MFEKWEVTLGHLHKVDTQVTKVKGMASMNALKINSKEEFIIIIGTVIISGDT